MLRQRVISALIFGPVVLIAAWLGGVGYLFLVGAASFLASREYLSLAGKMGYRSDRGLTVALVLLFLIFGAGYLSTGVVLGALTILTLLSLALNLVSQYQNPVTEWALGLAGGFYIGLLLSHFLLLRGLPRGWEWTLLVFTVTWAHDTGAYFVGLQVGRRKLAPEISPGKTWEGTIGGWAAGSLVAVAGGAYLGRPAGEALILGLVLSIAATAGDLVESLIKRRAGTKDSGTLMPGHGGILDRMDSLLFTVPVVYYYAHWFLGI